MAEYVSTATDRNVLGIVGFLNEYPSTADLREFIAKYRTVGEYATYSLAIDEGPDLEPDKGFVVHIPNMNMQYTQAIAYPTPTRFFGLSG